MVQHNKIILTPDQEQYLINNFSTTIHYTLCEHLGISKRTLVRMARERGLEKDMSAIEGQRRERISKSVKRAFLMNGYKGNPQNGEKTRFKPGYNAIEFFGEEKFREMHKKAIEARKRLYAEEHARVTFGLPQKTKIRVTKQPRQKILDRCYLKKRGYILDESNCIAYYTPDTNRATRMEHGWGKRIRYYYKFKPIENHEEEYQREPRILAVAGE